MLFPRCLKAQKDANQFPNQTCRLLRRMALQQRAVLGFK
jgi:hypothetical protein